MGDAVQLDAVFAPSEDVVARDIEGELILVPIAAGIGDAEDDLFTLNPTGRAIWQQLDGKRSLRQIASALAAEFDAPAGQIEADVLGLAAELAKRKLLVRK